MEDVLNLFQQETKAWFSDTLGHPTCVQKEAWPLIAGGRHVLVSAPTGTGKTLSAFLVFLDRMKRQAQEGVLKQQLQLIYVSPLKSLAADIRENLRRPLEGIHAAQDITVAVRTGDTPQKDRQKMVRKPPHILIITPESLYLMLTAKSGQHVLATAEAVIIDELHALIDTKRGAHLMLSFARLDQLCGRRLQRIGLSATIEPLETAAAYLAPEKAEIAAPYMKKKVRLEIRSPYADLTKGRRKDPVWEELGALVYEYCQGNRSVIAFVEGRRYAEKLAYYVNQKAGEGYARVHHGSLSKEQRMETEAALREGKLRLLCATSSMELGIDVGEIDQVLQIGCPRTVSGTMQRLGRAGHNPGRVSVMYMFARTAAECVTCGMTAQLARKGGVEHVNPPSECLDVLAQHLVSMAAFGSYTLDEVLEILPRAWPFRNLTKEDVKSVLGMLAGDYEHSQDIPVRPRVLYDRIHEKVEGDGYSRMLAVSAGGTIPDKGLYAVRTEEGVKLGEVDEEFVYESQKGDRFILGSFAWRVLEITRDTVIVTQAPVEGARLPFWKGELKGRDKRTAEAFGRMFCAFQTAYENGNLYETLEAMGLDDAAVKLSAGYLERQIKAAGSLPDHKTIVVEHFKDSSGKSQIMVHSVFGRRINAPLALLAAKAVKERFGTEAGFADEEEGFLLYSYGEKELPKGILQQLDPDTCIRQLEILLPAEPVFNIAFRYNSGRALMMGVKRAGRQPLWMQRLKSAQMLEHAVWEKKHPLIRETVRECMQEIWDAKGLLQLLNDIRSGMVHIREIYTQVPSPMSLPLQWAQEAAVMYDYTPTPQGIHEAVEKALQQEQELAAPDGRELLRLQERDAFLKIPQNAVQLHSLLMTEGDLAAGELAVPADWLDRLAQEGRALYLEQGLWIAAEQKEEYDCALGDDPSKYAPFSDANMHRLHIIRRMLRYRGAADTLQTAERYGWTADAAQDVLTELCRRGEVVEKDGMYYHKQLYRRAVVRTVKSRREEIKTCPPSAYAALMLSRLQSSAPADECLRSIMKQYKGAAFPAAYWESILLAGRIKNYRESVLDRFLTEGELFWHMGENGMVRFDALEEVDWEADCTCFLQDLTEKERIIYEALLKRGASFMQPLNRLLAGESAYDTLMSLMEKGLVYADSFVPVRQWLEREKTKKAAPVRRVNMRLKAFHAGRWDVARPLKGQYVSDQAASGSVREEVEKKLESCFDRMFIISRETAAVCGISWQEALSVLSIWEYTGRAARGYFVQGMSGAQFIRREDCVSVTRRLRLPEENLVWISAADPAQCWGKILPHEEGRHFLNVPGCAVACYGGRPVAVIERQGKVLRIFEEQYTQMCIRLFAEAYKSGKLFSSCRRIVVKTYPASAAQPLAAAGFLKEMNDYVLYR